MEQQCDMLLICERWFLYSMIVGQLIISGYASNMTSDGVMRKVKDVCPVLLTLFEHFFHPTLRSRRGWPSMGSGAIKNRSSRGGSSGFRALTPGSRQHQQIHITNQRCWGGALPNLVGSYMPESEEDAVFPGNSWFSLSSGPLFFDLMGVINVPGRLWSISSYDVL